MSGSQPGFNNMVDNMKNGGKIALLPHRRRCVWRRIQDHQPGFIAQQRGKRLPVRTKMRRLERHAFHYAAGQFNRRGVAIVAWVKTNHLIARTHQGGYRRIQRFGRPCGYRDIALFQIALSAVLVCSLPLWHKRPDAAPDGTVPKALTLPQVFALPGAKEVMLCFFCYCALETPAGLWASSYLTLVRQVPAQTAASLASLFYIGITAGRGVCGFLTLKLSDDQMIRLGFAVLGVGIAALLLPGAQVFALAGLVLVGLGCAPIYPSVIHATPAHFGAQNSQAVIGIQMSSAYVGNLAMPPLFGLLANNITPALFPFYLLVFLVLMALMHRQLVRKTSC